MDPNLLAAIALEILKLANKIHDSIPPEQHHENWRNWQKFIDDTQGFVKTLTSK